MGLEGGGIEGGWWWWWGWGGEKKKGAMRREWGTEGAVCATHAGDQLEVREEGWRAEV